MKIGVIADTHIPRRQRQLPAALNRAFAGVDIILHAGDVCSLETLRELQNRFAITVAVHGEDDDEEVQRYLEAQQVVEFAGRRLGLIHGHQLETGNWLQRAFRGKEARDAALRQRLPDAFEDVECVVYGHTHRPCNQMRGGVLLFNPGPAAPNVGRRPSVGLLDLETGAMSARVVYLDEV